MKARNIFRMDLKSQVCNMSLVSLIFEDNYILAVWGKYHLTMDFGEIISL